MMPNILCLITSFYISIILNIFNFIVFYWTVYAFKTQVKLKPKVKQE